MVLYQDEIRSGMRGGEVVVENMHFKALFLCDGVCGDNPNTKNEPLMMSTRTTAFASGLSMRQHNAFKLVC